LFPNADAGRGDPAVRLERLRMQTLEAHAHGVLRIQIQKGNKK
jgi:hypothetical protein